MNKLIFVVIALAFITTSTHKEVVRERKETLQNETHQDSSLLKEFESLNSESKKNENFPNTIRKYGSVIGKKALALPKILSNEVSQMSNRIINLPNVIHKKVNTVSSQVKNLFQKLSGLFNTQDKNAEFQENIVQEIEEIKEEKEASTKAIPEPINITADKNNKHNLSIESGQENTAKFVQPEKGEVPDLGKIENEIKTPEITDLNTSEKLEKHSPAYNSEGFFNSFSIPLGKFKDFSVKTFQSLKEKAFAITLDKTNSHWKSIRKKLNETSNPISTCFGSMKQKIKRIFNRIEQSLSFSGFKQPFKSLPLKISHFFENKTILKETKTAFQKIKLQLGRTMSALTDEFNKTLHLLTSGYWSGVSNKITQKFHNVTDFINKCRLEIYLNIFSVLTEMKVNAQKLPDKFIKTFSSAFFFSKNLFFKGVGLICDFFTQASGFNRKIWNEVSYTSKSNIFPFFYSTFTFIKNKISLFTDSMRSLLVLVIYLAILLLILCFLPTFLSIFGTTIKIISLFFHGTVGVLSLLKGIAWLLKQRIAPDRSREQGSKHEKGSKLKEGPRRFEEKNQIFRSRKNQRFYGYFKCPECKGKWESRNTFEDSPQKCKSCGTNVFPYWQIKLLKNDEK